MGLPKITFNIATDGLGLAESDVEKIPGIVVTGNTVAGKITIGESKQFFSFDEATESGITETDNPFAYKHVKAFYDYAGTGAELWLMLMSDATTMTTACDKNEQIAKKLLNDAAGNIRVLGVVREQTGSETITNGLDADVDTAAVKLNELAEEFAGNYFPFRGILSGGSFSGTVSELKDYSTTELNRVSVLIGNTDGEADAAIGLALGRLSSIPVQRNIGRVKDGAVEQLAAYFTDGEKTESKLASWDAIADKHYIFFRNFAGKSGFYFTDDPTLTGDDDDFVSLARGFVMDKAVILAYNVLVENLGDEILMTESGNIHSAIIKSWQNAVENTLNTNMTDDGELSACKCYIDETQDVLTSNEMVVQIQLQPVGYAKFITVNIGFTTEINS